MKLSEAIKLGSLQKAQVVAGAAGIDRTIRWVHIVDLPDPLPWVRPGDFMLTTGYAWPADEAGIRKLIANMAERGLAGIGLAVPKFLPRMPDAARQAADEHRLPLVEIPWDIPFTAITEEIHNVLLSRQALASLESQLGNSLLDSLLEGTFEPSPQAFRRAEMLGLHKDGFYSVAMIVMDLPIPLSRDGIVRRERLIELLKRLLAEANVPALLSLEQNQIYFLIPESYSAARIWEKIKAPELTLAVSRSFQGFDNIKLSCEELRSVISHLRMGTMQRYEQLLVPRVLMGDSDARSAFLELLLGPLRRAKNGDIFIQSILETARRGFHLKKTAAALHIHPKTLRYRLDRAIAIGGFDLADAEIQFQLQLAARLLSAGDPPSANEAIIPKKPIPSRSHD